jgi:serine/threonine-protein kinase HipA
MTMSLQVYWGSLSTPIGELVKDGETSTFRYHAGTSEKHRLSHSMPVDPLVRYPSTYFENLLPDGVQRERLARRLGVSDASTFTMLEAIGGDCAGAISLRKENAPPSPASRRALDDDLMVRMLTEGVLATSVTEGLRLSLAGAQDKLPVILDGGQLYLPEGQTPSTHILKFPNRDFQGLSANEHFALTLAAAAGLNVPESALFPLPSGEPALLVTRYDRHEGQRLHQEDTLQALAQPPSQKYEADGGPSLVKLAALVADASTVPEEDLLGLVRWQAFNIAIGNNDGHAKNVALLREPKVRLAPAYDLVCTRAWPQLDKNLAISVGDVRDGGTVTPVAWKRFADEALLSSAAVLRTVQATTERTREIAPDVAARLADEGADPKAIRRASEVVDAATRVALRRLEERSQRSRRIR